MGGRRWWIGAVGGLLVGRGLPVGGELGWAGVVVREHGLEGRLCRAGVDRYKYSRVVG